MPELSKLQIRAKVMAVVSEIKSVPDYNVNLLKKYIEELDCISDKTALLGIFLKEYIKMDEQEYNFCACLLKEIIPKNVISDLVTENIKSKSLSDDLKYKLVRLLRVAGVSCDFNELPSYFEKPAEVIDIETKKLLERAVFNPESMLDFLDFVSAVSSQDRYVLLQSLAADYHGDILANIIYPILYSDFEDSFILSAVEILSESKSSLGIAPFNYLIETSNNTDIINACKTGLKKLKIAGASQEKAEEYFCAAVKNSSPAEFYTTIPDGNSNQAFLISRKTNFDKYLLMAVVINDINGVLDTFGFYDIESNELLKLTAKFYKSEGRYKVSPEYVKTRVMEAFEQSVKQKKKLPYEFICWLPLLSDIKPLENSIISFADSQFEVRPYSKDDICNLLTKEHTFRWFISVDDNKIIKIIFDKFYASGDYDINVLNTEIKNNIDIVFDSFYDNLWKNKLYNLIYLLAVSNERSDAFKYYTLLKNDEFFRLFKDILLQRSIFNYAVRIYENLKEPLFGMNIFKKRSSEHNEYDIKKMESIIETLRKNWING